ncbi:phosphonopyruvate decarboxylase [Burkholderia sp. Bp9142]|uniref:phosphonopyruvate decarboxylase n=1 Tax=Burkholderia sp. Bp9142 TaxID=2184573 RepID=UPI0021AB345D|nr:phosphonopyruvate decarboxylase [Burkholderia sp. Bp9142]
MSTNLEESRDVREAERDLGIPDDTNEWPVHIYQSFKNNDVRQVCYVPDGGHARLISLCKSDANIISTALTTEEEGVGVVAGAWLGGQRSALLMQSSGVGNCVNLFSLLSACTFPAVIVVTMRGQWGEFVPWQIPMGQATKGCFDLMGFAVLEVPDAESVAGTMQAAFQMAYGGGKSVAVLISQRLIGAKTFSK